MFWFQFVGKCLEVLSDVNMRPWFYMASKNMTTIFNWLMVMCCQDKGRKNLLSFIECLQSPQYEWRLTGISSWNSDHSLRMQALLFPFITREEAQRAFSSGVSKPSYERWGRMRIKPRSECPPEPLLSTTHKVPMSSLHGCHTWLWAPHFKGTLTSPRAPEEVS